LSFEIIELLDAVVTRDTAVFEFGGGGSTLWFADRAGTVVTVEHDHGWAHDLRAATTEDPRTTILAHDASDGYEAYVNAIRAYPDEHFDVVLIDGRERVRCVAAAAPKLRPGGLLVLDDSERPLYARAGEILDGWPCQVVSGLAPFKPVAGTTTVWRRPA
jgi:predicted O-methyltransferase YrrM